MVDEHSDLSNHASSLFEGAASWTVGSSFRRRLPAHEGEKIHPGTKEASRRSDIVVRPTVSMSEAVG